jgi:hypothetical protein
MDLTNFLQPVFWIKVIALVVIGFYVIFTFVVFAQIRAMSKILRLPRPNGILKMISKINIFLAISLFLFAIVIL